VRHRELPNDGSAEFGSELDGGKTHAEDVAGFLQKVNPCGFVRMSLKVPGSGVGHS
jgi:hypothetical protein